MLQKNQNFPIFVKSYKIYKINLLTIYNDINRLKAFCIKLIVDNGIKRWYNSKYKL